VDNVLAAKSEGVGLIVRAISFKDFQHNYVITIHQRHGQTDGRTDYMREQERALHYSALHGKNCSIYLFRTIQRH